MRLGEFLQTWRGVQAANRWLWLAVLLLATANLLAWLHQGRQETVVVLTPPALSEPVQVARRQADARYKMVWGLFFAQLLGNVTPGSAELILPALDPLLDPVIYQPVRETVAAELATFTRERVTTQFAPRQTEYNATTDTVFVSGALTTTGAVGTPQRSERTYELKIAVADYRPRLTYITVYNGPPRNLPESR